MTYKYRIYIHDFQGSVRVEESNSRNARKHLQRTGAFWIRVVKNSNSDLVSTALMCSGLVCNGAVQRM